MSNRISMLLVVVLILIAHPKIPADNDDNSSRSSGGVGGGDDDEKEMKVGVIVDLGSWSGHNILNCIQMAVTDFYASHNTDSGEGKRRIVLHTRDSMGDPMHALTAAVDLLESVKVEAILVPETYSEAKILALLADKAKTPVFTFSPLFTSYERHPFLVQIKQDQIFQFKGLASILRFYEWNMVNIVYEDSYYGKECLPFLIDSLEEERVHVAHKIPISGIYTDYEIVSMLYNLATSQTTINILHVSTTTIIDRLFLFVKRMGIMKAGHVLIITEYNMNTLDDNVLLGSLQADVIGIKAHIPASSKLKEFTIRWRKGFNEKSQKMEQVALVRQPCFSCILAYDTLWALADCLERVEKQPAEGSLLNEMGKTSFAGLSGEFQILNGKIHSTETYAIINVNSKGDRIVGYWTRKHGLVKEAQVDDEQLQLQVDDPRRGLQAAAVRPKGRVGVPPRRLLGGGKKLRIGVIINPGYPEFVDFYHDPVSSSIRFKGYCIEVFEAAISSLDYEIAYEIIPTKGDYNQMVYQVYDGVYDGILGDLTITANRSLYVDFTMPYTDLGVGTIAKRSSDMWFFTRPLSRKLWLISAIHFALIGLVVWIIEHPDNEEFQGSISKQVGTILSFGFSTLVYAHREKLKNNLSKFVVNVWLCVVLILTSSYTATLSSIMTIRQIQLASMDSIGIQSLLIKGAIIADNVNFQGRLQLCNSPEAFAAALSKGSKKGGVTAIIDEIPYIKIFLGKYGRDYSMVESKSTTDGFAFGFRKGQARLVSDMSRAILEMREEGRLAMLEELWYNKRKLSSFIPPEADDTNLNTLTPYSFGGLFLITSISIAIALILHLIFMLVKRVQQKLIFGAYFLFFLRFLAPTKQNELQLANM